MKSKKESQMKSEEKRKMTREKGISWQGPLLLDQ